MNKKDIMAVIKPYEAKHTVDKYVINGWHVWPLLKMIACMGYLTEGNRKFSRYNLLRRTYIFKILRWINRKRITYFYDKEHHDPCLTRRDAVILTLSDRRVNIMGAFYNIHSDPLVEILNNEGISTVVWETGKEKYPRFSKSAWISRQMIEESERLPAPSFCEKPDWFFDYQKFACEIRGKNISWFQIKFLIDKVTNQSIIFEKWLRRAGAKYLFVICWYDPFVMSAILAAHRCGIKVIELQHGAEGDLHYAYSNWMKTPLGGYEVTPDVFWCWGNDSVTDKKKYNTAFSKEILIIAGGNLWLNWWRKNKLKNYVSNSIRKQGKYNRRILVSLQIDIPSFLLEAIIASPHSWLWQIRYHPSWSVEKQNKYEKIFNGTRHPGIDLVKSNDQYLYGLLYDSDVHVTGFSTCALEAVAFGVPTVIIDEVGVSIYKEFIKQGLMLSADTALKLNSGILQLKKICIEQCDVIENIFASDEDSYKALSKII